jgi:hypothetical protein
LWARNEIIQEYGLNACNRTSEVKWKYNKSTTKAQQKCSKSVTRV